MSMHLENPRFTTLNTKKRKKLSVKQRRAAEQHEEWLKSQGIHISQLEKSKSKKLTKVFSKSIDTTGSCTNGFANSGFKKSVFDTNWNKKYDDDPLMAERERAALEQAHAIKQRLMPLYNKGPVQLNTDIKSLKDGNGRGKQI